MKRVLLLSMWLGTCGWLGCAACYGDDLDAGEVANLLTARRQTLDAGAIKFKVYEFSTTGEEYQKMRAMIMRSRTEMQAPAVLRDSISRLLSESKLEPVRGFNGSYFYKGQKWRLNRSRNVEFDREQERIEALAKQHEMKPMRDLLLTEDVSFDEKEIHSLVNGNWFFYRRASHASDYPSIMSIDISLGLWQMVNEKGTAPGQVISAEEKDGAHVLTFSNKGEAGEVSSAAHYTFDPALGYAPVEVVTELNERVLMEILYGYADDGKVLPRPTVVSHAKFGKDDKVRLELWVIEDWSDDVRDEDFRITLPENYMVVDGRYGDKPLVYEQEYFDVDDADMSTTSPVQRESGGMVTTRNARVLNPELMSGGAEGEERGASGMREKFWPRTYLIVSVAVGAGLVALALSQILRHRKGPVQK